MKGSRVPVPATRTVAPALASAPMRRHRGQTTGWRLGTFTTHPAASAGTGSTTRWCVQPLAAIEATARATSFALRITVGWRRNLDRRTGRFRMRFCVIPYRDFEVLAPDPHRFDADHDGVGCKS